MNRTRNSRSNLLFCFEFYKFNFNSYVCENIYHILIYLDNFLNFF